MPRAPDWFEFSGGALCLDFANTVSERPTPTPVERLETCDDLLLWAERAGILTAADARRRAHRARRQPQMASRALADAKICRELVYGVCADAAAGRDLRASLDELSKALRRLLPSTALTLDKGAPAWSYAGAPQGSDALLWPILWSAAELLTSDQRGQIRECEARDCGWLFLEASRGHRRRWCNMRVCGNREKVRRFRAAEHEGRR